MYATNMGGLAPFGVEGWRFVLFSVSILSVCCGILNAIFVYDPTFERQQQQQREKAGFPHSPTRGQSQQAAGALGVLKSAMHDIAVVMRIPTFTLM